LFMDANVLKNQLSYCLITCGDLSPKLIAQLVRTVLCRF
jgi:hypothetical protein